MKSIMRDKIGSFMSRGDCERFLNKWIVQYVTEDDNASPATKAQYPLREARVDVAEIPGKPGAYRAIAFLRPHFQLDELTVSMRLVADLPPSTRG
jgi:type VI secretion system protein ImpC